MPPPVPEKISCTTVAEFTSELRNVQTALNLPETEDNWEKISRALQQLAALVRGGAYKLETELVAAIKTNYKPITTSMLTERTRLSASALDLVSAMAPRLAARFEPLVAILFPSLLKVLTRPNKVYVTRGQACLLLIVEHCHLPVIIPHLREASKDKSVSLRLGVTEAILQLVSSWDRAILEVREGASTLLTRHKGNVEDIETIIKETARDANPAVRQVSRQVFDKYSEIWPERLDAFTSPLTPTIRRYLNAGKDNGSRKAPVPAPPMVKARPARPPSPHVKATVPAGPSRPARPHPQPLRTAPLPRSEAPYSRPASRLGGHGPSQLASSSSSATTFPPIPNRAMSPAVNDIGALMRAEAHHTIYRVPLVSSKPSATSSTSSSMSSAPPSRPPSRAQHTQAEPQQPGPRIIHAPTSSSSQSRPQVGGPPRRPALITTRSAQEENVEAAMPKASSSTAFVRVERAKVDPAPPAGPVGPVRPPLATTRTVSMKDPPSRPLKQLKPDDGDGRTRPMFAGNLGFKLPPPPPQPKSAHVAREAETVDAAVEDVKDEADANNEAEEDAGPEAQESGASAPAQTTKILPSMELLTPANQRPAGSLSHHTASVSSNSKRPAVLQKRAAGPPAGQVQGFAPTRKRPGVTEPTLSQMAKQRPTKTFVPAAKKPDLPQPPPAPKKTVALPAKVITATATTAAKEGPKPGLRKPLAGKPGVPRPASKTVLPPVSIPREVQIAVQVPLPPVTPDEAPLPPVEADEVPLPPVEADEVPLPDVEADEISLPPMSTAEEPLPSVTSEERFLIPLGSPRQVKVSDTIYQWDEDDSVDTVEVATPKARSAPRMTVNDRLLLDWDATVIMPGVPRRSIAPPGSRSPTQESDLMDFDMSIILPHDKFAPMAAYAPIAVLRDPSPPVMVSAVRAQPLNKVKGKEFGEPHRLVERVALSEREVNTMS